MNKKDSLGDRMKGYENVSRPFLMKRMPVIIRIDGVHFHTFTRGMNKPVDMILQKSMIETMFQLCENIQGCKFGYVQSDEISLLLTDYENLNTSAWFDNCLTKIVSVSASMATMFFNKAYRSWTNMEGSGYHRFPDIDKYRQKRDTAYFDARAFNLHQSEVCNYFLWRQQDCVRNSIEALGRSKFSHKQLENVNGPGIKEMLKEVHNIIWEDTPLAQQRGVCAYRVDEEINEEKTRKKWILDENIPIFSENRNYIESHLE